MADLTKYRLLNAAAALRVAFTQYLGRWSKNKKAPNLETVKGKKVNRAHVLMGEKILLTKDKATEAVLFGGKTPNEYAKTVSESLLKDYARTHTKFLSNYKWNDLWETYKEVNQPPAQ